MKVKDIIKKIRLVNTEIVISEEFKELKTLKTAFSECEYNERTVISIQPLSDSKIVINIKPL